ncbi:mycothiol synthase [Sanguibacter gelidistatuariae]|uniref:Mycothiol acetyltransferase n=1 Tax=Sanguibacter gelidistatuariae TaxID=1814289 RepID=A0A1G6HJ06_9MICO|nr:mycothiol synthase [Sanguibacter gelidistatuariae]SDB94232.1 mycothiol synthase [Sanguibacter gelidistatuariae]
MDDTQIAVVTGPLTEADAGAVRRLVRAAEHVDGVAPLSEQPLLWLTDPAARVAHLLVRAADDLAGYAQVDLAVAGAASAELVVHPFARRHGVGSGLLDRAQLLAQAGRRTLKVWAHGDLPAARALADRAGLTVVRELWKMDLDLTTYRTETLHLPGGVHLATFRPGADDAAWLEVNARAFASHPEQGRLTAADLATRMNEPWFDPESFLLAWRGAELLGFSWLKVSGVATDAGKAGGTGEIYALGVDPSARGLRLGSALTRASLDRLAALGLATAELYTEGDNTVAVHTYSAVGFTRVAVDVQLGLARGTQNSSSDVTMNL